MSARSEVLNAMMQLEDPSVLGCAGVANRIWEEKFKRYARHDVTCKANRPGRGMAPQQCDCGLWEVVEP